MAIGSVTNQAPFVGPRTLNLDPVIPVVRRILEEDTDFLRPLKTVMDCLDSGPLVNVSIVSLKSVPYVAYGDRRIVKEFENGVSCRLRYLEAAVTSLAAFVYNFVFGFIFSALSLVTLGQVRLINDQMQKQWVHTALSIVALGISCVGTISPDLGIRANLAGGFVVVFGLLQLVQGDVITKITTTYQHRSGELRQAVEHACRNSGINSREFTPFFNYLDANLNNNRVTTFSEFSEVIQSAAQQFPIFIPTASPQVILSNLQELASHWRNPDTQQRNEPISSQASTA
jgi:hypothetical protein